LTQKNPLFFAPLRDLCDFAVNFSTRETTKHSKLHEIKEADLRSALLSFQTSHRVFLRAPPRAPRFASNPKSSPFFFASLRDLCDFAVTPPTQGTTKHSKPHEIKEAD
jgi:hypothetical protein